MKSKVILLFILSFSTLGFSNLSVSANSSSNGYYYKDYGFSHFTRYNLDHMQDGLNRTGKNNPIGNFSHLNVTDLFSARDDRNGTIGQQMNVWDSWPLQDSNGNVVDYKGYHITFALTGNPNLDYTSKDNKVVQDSRIFLYYQKIGQEYLGAKSWHNAGPVFKSSTEGVNGQDNILNRQVAQWSGTTVMLPNNKIRMFYTIFNGTNDDTWQSIATVQLTLKLNKNSISIDHSKTTGNKTILKPDGNLYQKNSQSLNNPYDENVFRDPHYFTYNGKKYLIFSANSGPKMGPEGSVVLNNRAYFGGSNSFIKSENNLLNEPYNNNLKEQVKAGNSVFGIAELNNNFTFKKFLKPLLGFNAVTDEVERPNLFEHNGKWYLFGVTRAFKLFTSKVNYTDSFMLGFIGKTPFGPFKPLNKNGMVIRNTRSLTSHYYTYSFYVLNNSSNRLLVTSYMNNAKGNNYHMTFAPTMTLKLNRNKTSIIRDDILPQGTTLKGSASYIK